MSRFKTLSSLAGAMAFWSFSHGPAAAQNADTQPDSLILHNGAVVKQLSHSAAAISDNNAPVLSAYYINKTLYADPQGYAHIRRHAALREALSNGLDELYESVAPRDTIQGHITLYSRHQRQVMNAEIYSPNPWQPDALITHALQESALDIAAFNDATDGILYDRAPFQRIFTMPQTDDLVIKHGPAPYQPSLSRPKP